LPASWGAGTMLAVNDQLDGCVIVSGMPGAGKSTVTLAAARRTTRAAQVKADDLHEMIKSGRVAFGMQPRHEQLRQAELADRNLAALAANFIDYGFTVFMDHIVVDRDHLARLVQLLAPRPVRLVTLAPSIEVCRHRNQTRDPDESWDFQGYDDLEAELRRNVGDLGWWFDTSDLTPDDTAAQLVREAATRAVLPTVVAPRS
jgi:chloramphenicol 3-O-phosphotransferase